MHKNQLDGLKISNYIALILIIFLIYLVIFYYKNTFLEENFITSSPTSIPCPGMTFKNSKGLCRPVSERIPSQNNTCPTGYLIDSRKKWCWLNS